jgi:hypothetical protein
MDKLNATSGSATRRLIPRLTRRSLQSWEFLYRVEQLGAWHPGCSFGGTSNPLKEHPMKILLATMFKKVPVRKTKQRATICKRCGTRIYSMSYLKVHLESHDRSTH